ncbi:40S ribosomal protein S5-1 [Hordeum vulgare]|nr:40S ribosomal protein S5-1 [Hordeum vulgare]
MHEGVLHIRDVVGPQKTGSIEARLKAMEQQVFKCQGMVERGLNANHMMITDFTNKHKIDANDIGKHVSRLYDIIDHLQAQIYDLQNQNYDPLSLRLSTLRLSQRLSTLRLSSLRLSTLHLSLRLSTLTLRLSLRLSPLHRCLLLDGRIPHRRHPRLQG